MGFFKTLGLNREKAQSEAAPEAPKMEVQEKSATEVGRERVNAIKEAAKARWERFKAKAGEVGSFLLEKGTSLIFTAVGGVEKGAKATIKGVESTVKYARETGREGMDIAQLATEALKDDTTRVKEAAVEAGLTGAALIFMAGDKGVEVAKAMKERGVELKSAAGKKLAEGVAVLANMGLDAAAWVIDNGAEKMEQAVDVARQAKAAGIDLAKRGGDFALSSLVTAYETGISVKESIESAASTTLEKGREIVGVAKEKIDALRGRAYEAKVGFFARLTAARDRFSAHVKDAAMEALRPNINAEVSRRVREILEARQTLTAAAIEAPDRAPAQAAG